MQLLLYKTGKLVSAYDICGDMGSAFDLTQTLLCSTKTFEWLCHVPFGRRIEECHFITFHYVFKCYDFHTMCIEEHIGIAAMVDILKMLGLEHDMFIDPLVVKYLNRLSDHLFVLARYIAHLTGVSETEWKARINTRPH